MAGPTEWFDAGLKLAELITFVGGGGVILWKLGRAVGKFEEISVQQSEEIKELKDAVKETNEVFIKIAVQTQTLSDLSSRLGRTEAMLDDLRRGEGRILPLNPRPLPNER